MKKVLIILMAMFMTVGCSSAPKDAAKSSDGTTEVVANNDAINDEGTDEKENSETEVNDQIDDTTAESSKTDNNKNEKTTATAKETSKQSTTKKDSSQKKEATGDTGKSSTTASGNSNKETSTKPTEAQKPAEPSQPPISSDTGKDEQPVSPKPEPVKPDYKVGNSGKLFNTESEAYTEAYKQLDDFSDPEKYISSFLVYSTYDKWSLSYTYTYY